MDLLEWITSIGRKLNNLLLMAYALILIIYIYIYLLWYTYINYIIIYTDIILLINCIGLPFLPIPNIGNISIEQLEKIIELLLEALEQLLAILYQLGLFIILCGFLYLLYKYLKRLLKRNNESLIIINLGFLKIRLTDTDYEDFFYDKNDLNGTLLITLYGLNSIFRNLNLGIETIWSPQHNRYNTGIGISSSWTSQFHIENNILTDVPSSIYSGKWYELIKRQFVLGYKYFPCPLLLPWILLHEFNILRLTSNGVVYSPWSCGDFIKVYGSMSELWDSDIWEKINNKNT